MRSQQRTLKERVIHATSFEVSALIIISPFAAWAMDKPLFQMGALTVLLSSIAMLWNIVYNAGFDRLYPPGQSRAGRVRVLHGLGFEGGFILIGLPIAAWMLKLTLLEAFMLEIGLFLCYLPFTILFNWVYDTVRARVMQTAHSH